MLFYIPLVNSRYPKMKPYERGHYPLEPLKVELGIWQGEYLVAKGVNETGV
jgi:hypothetical protein